MTLLLAELTVMHDEIRDAHQLPGMIEYVRDGGLWTMDAIRRYAAQSGDRCEPIYITRFPDNALYAHDGHRRIIATLLAGRRFLSPSEYVQYDWTYEDYMGINWDRNYVTPHNPRVEVRLPEFFKYKQFVLSIKSGREAAEAFIWLNKDLYCRPRTIWTMDELATRYSKSVSCVSIEV